MNEPEIFFAWRGLLFPIVLSAIVSVLIYFLFVIGEIANKRGRSSFGWCTLSLFVSPIITAYFLAVLGETDEKRKERIIEEEKWKSKVRTPKDPNTEMENWLKENLGKSINDYYLSDYYKNNR